MAKMKMPLEIEQAMLKSEAAMQEMLTEIDLMEECGDDCQAFREQVKEQLQKSMKYRQNFGQSSKLPDRSNVKQFGE